MNRLKCKKCLGNKFWHVHRGKLRCQNCLYEFKPKFGGLSLSKYQWKKLLKWFLRCLSVNVIVEETGISKYKVLKVSKLVRQIMTKDIPQVFDGMVEVDETYLGGQNKNKKQLKRENVVFGESKRGFGTTKQPVFGIPARNGKVFAQVVDDTEAKDLIPIIEKRVKKGLKSVLIPRELIPDWQPEVMSTEL